MIFGLILAGGKGTRMGNVEKPKQFMDLCGKPIIVHTIEKFVINSSFEKIIVLSPKQWIKHTQDIVKKYLPNADKVIIIEGGSTRNETIMNGIKYIEENYILDDETIIVTHDSVRPFVTHRIIEENINYTQKYVLVIRLFPQRILSLKAVIMNILRIFLIEVKCIRGKPHKHSMLKD